VGVGLGVEAVLAAFEAVADSLAQPSSPEPPRAAPITGRRALRVHEALQRGKDLLVREVARDTENYERIRLLRGHDALYGFGAAVRSMWPPNSRRMAERSRFAKSS
jgi:hypothetical protein